MLKLDGSVKTFETLAQVNQDGHPSFYNEYVITDTYPNADGKINLIIKNNNSMVDDDFSLLLNHDVDFNDSILRCDAHPSVCKKSGLITVDRLCNSLRYIEVYKIEK